MLVVTFGSVYESLLDGGAGKFGSFPVVSCTGGSGLAGGTAWNWGASNGVWFCWTGLFWHLYKLMIPEKLTVKYHSNLLSVIITWDYAPHDHD